MRGAGQQEEGSVRAIARTEGQVRLSDGRLLGYAEFGTAGGLPVLYCHGFPGSRLEAALTAESAVRLGLRIIAADRPGIGLSDAAPSRTLADWAQDAAEMADALAIDRFAVLGVSGGGPYAAACAALLPQRVTATALVASLGPLDQPPGTGGMPLLNRLVLSLFRRAPTLGHAFFILLAGAGRRRPALIFRLLTLSLPPPDRQALQGRAREIVLASYREALRRGPAAGSRELFLYARPWDFALHKIATPVLLWHGKEDPTIPVAMGHRLRRLVPGCTACFVDGEGHFSLPIRHLGEILKSLKDTGQLPSV